MTHYTGFWKDFSGAFFLFLESLLNIDVTGQADCRQKAKKFCAAKLADLFNVDNQAASRLGFTLAEVLITLGIIGIVAAMTMPSLIANYRKQVYVNQLKKTMSTLQQGFQKMMADDEVDNLEDTSVFIASRNGNDEECMFSGDINTVACQALIQGFKKYFDVIDFKVPQNYIVTDIDDKSIRDNISEYEDYYFILKDGTMIRIDSTYSPGQMWTDINGKRHYYNQCLSVILDINGTKGPNTTARDVFDFRVTDDGKLVWYDLLGGEYMDKILKDGWQMKY